MIATMAMVMKTGRLIEASESHMDLPPENGDELAIAQARLSLHDDLLPCRHTAQNLQALPLGAPSPDRTSVGTILRHPVHRGLTPRPHHRVARHQQTGLLLLRLAGE